MTDRTVVVGEFLGQPIALSVDAYRAAVAAARRLLGAPAATPATVAAPSTKAGSEPLLTPDQAAELTGTRRGWWIKQARVGKVACTRVGRAVRFSRAQVSQALGNPDYLDPGIVHAVVTSKPLKNKGRASARNKDVTAIVPSRSTPDAGEAARLR